MQNSRVKLILVEEYCKVYGVKFVAKIPYMRVEGYKKFVIGLDKNKAYKIIEGIKTNIDPVMNKPEMKEFLSCNFQELSFKVMSLFVHALSCFQNGSFTIHDLISFLKRQGKEASALLNIFLD